jgi:hypothetical protein
MEDMVKETPNDIVGVSGGFRINVSVITFGKYTAHWLFDTW